MFGHLPRLFDRNFIVGYFLPAAVFIAASHWLISREFNLKLEFFGDLFKKDIGDNLLIFGLLSFVGGILLAVANLVLLRFLEGYWPLGLDRRLNWVEKWRYRRLGKSIDRVNRQYRVYQTLGKEPCNKLKIKLARLSLQSAERFAPEEHLLLPTSLGNILRAAEAYPRVMYGIDGVAGWNRLLGVVPTEYLNLVNVARTNLDLWVNLCVLSLLILAEYVVLAVYSGHLPKQQVAANQGYWFFLVPILSAAFFFISFIMAKKAAVIWGNWFKSAFDLYLADLRDKLGLVVPEDRAEERKSWGVFSQATIYRLPETLAERRKSYENPY